MSGHRHPSDPGYNANEQDQQWASGGAEGQTHGHYAQNAQAPPGFEYHQGINTGHVFPCQYFGSQESYQPTGNDAANNSGFQNFVPGVPPSFGDPGSQFFQPVIAGSNNYVAQNRFLGGYEPQMVPQFGEVIRRAFTRVRADGKEEYEPSMPRKEGDTIPDPVSIEEGGRTYQNYRAGKYYLPNDAVEQDRLDMNHVPFTMTFNGALHLSPVRKPARVLDIGTGTGIWAIDFAERNPESEVIGTDLSMIQPPVVMRLPNVKFFRDDAEEDWIFDEPFDFIHQRLMFSCLNDPRALAKKMFQNLKPGGWVEYQDSAVVVDSDDGSHVGTALHQWGCLAVAGAAAKGRDFDVSRKYQDYLLDAGFVDVTEKRLKLPGNGWPADSAQKKIGQFVAMSSIEACQAVSGKLLQDGLSWPVGDVEGLTRRAQEDIKNRDLHFWWPLIVVYGRKPFPGETETSGMETAKPPPPKKQNIEREDTN